MLSLVYRVYCSVLVAESCFGVVLSLVFEAIVLLLPPRWVSDAGPVRIFNHRANQKSLYETVIDPHHSISE